ncbi:MAG: hypothetical protein Kow0031_39240 [Anaerolineae bacterium]
MLKKSLIISWLLAFGLVLLPGQAQAQWPPFALRFASVFDQGKIIYKVSLAKKFDGPMADLVIKVPLPPGTRFLEAGGPDGTSATFDGQEVTFFTPTVHKPLRDAYMIVEVIDPAQIEYTTHAWLSWQGEVPGDYLTRDYSIDITRTPLDWQKPASRLRLEAGATAQGDTVTYNLYPTNAGGRRMWDLTIALPLPPGATFISATAPPHFEAGFDGQQAIFKILELERGVKEGPLQLTVSTAAVTETLISTQATAWWTNVGRNVEPQGATTTGDIWVQPGASQQVAADAAGDAPFANYDLTSVLLAQDDAGLKATFFTSEEMGPVGEPLEHYLYLDTDCNSDTGKSRGNRGAEYWVRYRHQNGRGYLYTWNPELQDWENRQRIEAFTAAGPTATVWIPRSVVGDTTNFCWLALSRNLTDLYHPSPPVDWAGSDSRLTTYQTTPPPAQ